MLGWAGTILAVIAGLQAEEVVDHGDAVHLAFVRHETMGLITLAVVSVGVLIGLLIVALFMPLVSLVQSVSGSC